MSRRRRRQPKSISLTLPDEPPTESEVDAILMAVDAVVGTAGRHGLSLILKGSTNKRLLSHGWDRLPDYGELGYLKMQEISSKIDWCVHHGWLRIEYERDGMPLLYHTTVGWDRVKELWVKRLIYSFEEWMLIQEPERVWPEMKFINHQIKEILLEAIGKEERGDLIPILEIWFPHEVRKIRQLINQTIVDLGEEALPNW